MALNFKLNNQSQVTVNKRFNCNHKKDQILNKIKFNPPPHALFALKNTIKI